jgi:PAS domain S-box-containing protein
MKKGEEWHQFLSSAVAQSFDGIAIADLDYKLIYVNSAWAMIHGYDSAEELIGKSIEILHNREQREKDVKPFIQVVKEKGINTGEMRHIRKDGTPFITLMTTTLLKDAQETPVAILGIIKDITEHKQVDELLLESKLKYQNLIESTSDWVWEVDEDGRYTYVSSRIRDLLGYEPEEVVHMTHFDLMSPEEAKRVREKFATAVAQHVPIKSLENTILHKDGHPVILETSGAPFFDATGKFSGYRGIDRDITERKQAEIALRKSEARFQSIISAAPTGIGVVVNRVLVEVNSHICEMTGRTKDELVGKSARVLYPTQEEFEFVGREKYRQIADRGIGTLETRWIKKDGSILNVFLSSSPIIPGDLSAGVTFTATDITERKRAEKEREKLENHLRQSHKMEAIGELAGGIAHDFNNILTAILGNINLALFDTDLKDSTKKLLSNAEKASLRAKGLTQQLLTFAKGGEPIKETSSIESVIRDSATFVLHGEKVVSQFDIPDNLWLVEIDKNQISQVIQNIVLNSSQAMPEGGVVKVTCKNVSSSEDHGFPLLQKGRFVKICIQDCGIGIPANVIDKIFDPYFSTKQMGNGLGLSITHSIISKHGGHISVKSSSGVGSNFTIYLPASGMTISQQQESLAENKASLQMKILIMDDEEIVRDVAKKMLVKLGYEVAQAANGEEVMKLYQESMNSEMPFDLVIMDLTIPGEMGGKEAVQKILKVKPDAKVMVSSGYSNDPIMANFKDYGFCAAITKPYHLQELSKVIGHIFN